MRRALVILKYVPAVLCGLLAVAWVVTCSSTVRLELSQGFIGIGEGWVGGYWMERQSGCVFFSWTISFPIPAVLTALAPISMLPFLRFPLWSYFAWTALIATELAYYLR